MKIRVRGTGTWSRAALAPLNAALTKPGMAAGLAGGAFVLAVPQAVQAQSLSAYHLASLANKSYSDLFTITTTNGVTTFTFEKTDPGAILKFNDPNQKFTGGGNSAELLGISQIAILPAGSASSLTFTADTVKNGGYVTKADGTGKKTWNEDSNPEEYNSPKSFSDAVDKATFLQLAPAASFTGTGKNPSNLTKGYFSFTGLEGKTFGTDYTLGIHYIARVGTTGNLSSPTGFARFSGSYSPPPPDGGGAGATPVPEPGPTATAAAFALSIGGMVFRRRRAAIKKSAA